MFEHHPSWARPSQDQLSSVFGGCSDKPLTGIDVVTSQVDCANPTLQVEVVCMKYPDGEMIEVPFPLFHAAETRQEQVQIGIETARVALSGLCRGCILRDRTG